MEMRKGKGQFPFFVAMTNLPGGSRSNSNPISFSTSLASYLRVLIFCLAEEEPSKKFSWNTVLNSENEISCWGCFTR